MSFFGNGKHNENMEHIEEFDKFALDVPPSYPDRHGSYEEWKNVKTFKTKEEAIAFGKEHFGCDDNGMICILSSF